MKPMRRRPLRRDRDRANAPGTMMIKGRQLYIACADEWLSIEELQISGKKRMAVADFLNGMRAIADYHCLPKHA